MDERAQVAAGILDRVRAMLRERRLTAREAPQPRPSQGAARATARLWAPLLGTNKRPVGEVRVVVIVPNDPAEAADVHVRWSRTGFGFWYVKTADVGVVGGVGVGPRAVDEHDVSQGAPERERRSAIRSEPWQRCEHW